MSEVMVLQHVACEGLGTIAAALAAEGITARYVRPYEGAQIPKETGAASGLIVMGGPMGVYEQGRYPFLRDELRLIDEALRSARPVLGICLGSQLLAASLGATVTAGRQEEIGWYPVQLAPAAAKDALWKDVGQRFTAYHWHGDVFALPAGAIGLASSEQTTHQAFRYGDRAYGLLFHLEVTKQVIGEMTANFADELSEAGVDGQGIVAQAGRFLPALHAIGEVFFGRWARLVR